MNLIDWLKKLRWYWYILLVIVSLLLFSIFIIAALVIGPLLSYISIMAVLAAGCRILHSMIFHNTERGRFIALYKKENKRRTISKAEFFFFIFFAPITFPCFIVYFILKCAWIILNYCIFLRLSYRSKKRFAIFPPFLLFYQLSLINAKHFIVSFSEEEIYNFLINERINVEVYKNYWLFDNLKKDHGYIFVFINETINSNSENDSPTHCIMVTEKECSCVKMDNSYPLPKGVDIPCYLKDSNGLNLLSICELLSIKHLYLKAIAARSAVLQIKAQADLWKDKIYKKPYFKAYLEEVTEQFGSANDKNENNLQK